MWKAEVDVSLGVLVGELGRVFDADFYPSGIFVSPLCGDDRGVADLFGMLLELCPYLLKRNWEVLCPEIS